jgi:branched-chain amino acid transport system permease protein
VLVRDAAAGRRALTTFGPALAILAVQLLLFPVPLGVFARGLIVGGLTALIALGMALVYRSNRILNFAQPDFGSLPAVLVFMLMTAWGVPWLAAVVVGIATSLVLGAVVELAVIRRFRRAPRLLLTVATLGLAQLLAAAAILLPRLWDDERLIAPRIEPPFTLRFEIDPLVFSANDVLAAIVAPLAVVALYLFLQRTSLGTAIRASAESADRASMLGIPVGRVQTLVWSVAGLLAFTATFLRAGVLGLPVTTALGFGILLRALAALMLGRLTNLPAIATASVALGVLELGVGWNASSPLLIDPILAVVVVVGLLLRKPDRSRTDAAEASSWQASDDVRPIPPELARLREVRLTRWIGGGLLVAAALILPNLLASNNSLKASAVLIYGIMGLSLVVLTGWSGQVSLGTVAFFAIGATVGAKATGDWGLDLTLALLLTAVVGALAAIVVGLPALRLRGLYLAVTTFAFALATTSYLLNRRFFDWVPTARVERPPLLGRIDLNSPTRIYYVVLAGLVVVLVAVHGLRHSRTGRVLIALRENERAAQSFGISAVRARLTAFAASGAIAAFAGCLFVHHQQAIGEGPYQPFLNFVVFTMVVIGGIASVPGALLGALYLQGTNWFLPQDWRPLASGLGVLAVLLVLPGGLGSLLYRLRDLWLRWVASRHAVHVPSMVADGTVEPEPESEPVPAAVP